MNSPTPEDKKLGEDLPSIVSASTLLGYLNSPDPIVPTLSWRTRAHYTTLYGNVRSTYKQRSFGERRFYLELNPTEFMANTPSHYQATEALVNLLKISLEYVADHARSFPGSNLSYVIRAFREHRAGPARLRIYSDKDANESKGARPIIDVPLDIQLKRLTRGGKPEFMLMDDLEDNSGDASTQSLSDFGKAMTKLSSAAKEGSMTMEILMKAFGKDAKNNIPHLRDLAEMAKDLELPKPNTPELPKPPEAPKLPAPPSPDEAKSDDTDDDDDDDDDDPLKRLIKLCK